MSHPFAGHRQTKVEHDRVSHIAKGYASGGAVHSDEAEDKQMIKKMVKSSAMRMDGGPVKARADKVSRARGGKIKKADGGSTPKPEKPQDQGPLVVDPRGPLGTSLLKTKPMGSYKGIKFEPQSRARGGRTKHGGGKHTVNVIVAPSGPTGPKPMAGMAPPPPMPTPGAPMPGRPMMPPPPAGIPGGGPPPGMPMRAKGGKVGQVPFKQDVKPSMNLKGNDRSKPSEADKAGAAKQRTKISHDKGKSDGPNIGRGAVITKATGGSISSSGAKMAPHAKSGAGGGLSRLDKQHHPDKYEC